MLIRSSRLSWWGLKPLMYLFASVAPVVPGNSTTTSEQQTLPPSYSYSLPPPSLSLSVLCLIQSITAQKQKLSKILTEKVSGPRKCRFFTKISYDAQKSSLVSSLRISISSFSGLSFHWFVFIIHKVHIEHSLCAGHGGKHLHQWTLSWSKAYKECWSQSCPSYISPSLLHCVLPHSTLASGPVNCVLRVTTVCSVLHNDPAILPLTCFLSGQPFSVFPQDK